MDFNWKHYFLFGIVIIIAAMMTDGYKDHNKMQIELAKINSQKCECSK